MFAPPSGCPGCGQRAWAKRARGYRGRMRVGKLRMAGVVGVLLALSGCVGEEPLPTLPPTPTATPIFASEEDALAAAEAAYAEYLDVASMITADYGENPQRIAPYVTETQLANELDTAEYYRTNGFRVEGVPAVTNAVLQQYDQDGPVAYVAFYVCLDVSSTRVLDRDGLDVTPARQDIGALEVLMVGPSARELKIESSQLWPESSFC